jgi:hypothetical protein
MTAGQHVRRDCRQVLSSLTIIERLAGASSASHLSHCRSVCDLHERAPQVAECMGPDVVQG